MTTASQQQDRTERPFTYARRWTRDLFTDLEGAGHEQVLTEARALLRIAGVLETERDVPAEVLADGMAYLGTERYPSKVQFKAWVSRQVDRPVRPHPADGSPFTWEQDFLDRIEAAVDSGCLVRQRCPDCGDLLLWAVDRAAGRALPFDPEPRRYDEGARYLLKPTPGTAQHYLARYPPKPKDAWLFRSHLTRCDAPSIAR